MPELYDNETEKLPRAILVTVDTGEFDAEVSLDELEELARTAGAETAAKIIQKRPSPDTATFIGSGRLDELAAESEALGADLLIFDTELTANQIRNIEAVTDIHTIDRTTLILDIFAMRAASAEGRIQVELAQQKYRLAHLAGYAAGGLCRAQCGAALRRGTAEDRYCQGPGAGTAYAGL